LRKYKLDRLLHGRKRAKGKELTARKLEVKVKVKVKVSAGMDVVVTCHSTDPELELAICLLWLAERIEPNE
jgi:hypothetical protein